MKTVFLNGLFLFVIFSFPLQNCIAADKLSTIQKQIKQGKSSQTQKNREQKILEDRVASLEQQTAAAILEVQQTEKALTDEKKRLTSVKKQTSTLQDEKQKQQKLLEQQLISTYMAGQNDLIKLLLNQEDLSKIIRAKSYYFYLNQARLESIEMLEKTQLQLDKKSQQQAQSLLALKKLYQQQTAIKEQLSKQRSQRKKSVARVKSGS